MPNITKQQPQDPQDLDTTLGDPLADLVCKFGLQNVAAVLHGIASATSSHPSVCKDYQRVAAIIRNSLTEAFGLIDLEFGGGHKR